MYDPTVYFFNAQSAMTLLHSQTRVPNIMNKLVN